MQNVSFVTSPLTYFTSPLTLIRYFQLQLTKVNKVHLKALDF